MVLQIIIIVFLAADIALEAIMYRKLNGNAAERRLDEQVEQAMETERREREDEFNEGFDNIMRFAVNGKTGFEGVDGNEP